MEHITSRSNRWIKCALRLKQRKWRDKEGLFLLEGFRGTTDVLEQQVKDCICFVEDGRFSDDVLEKITVEGERLHWLFLSVDEEMMNLISGTEHGQGILLLCRKQQHDLSELLHPLKGYYVVLDSVQDPGNMGTILRTCAAAGVKGLILTEGCTDIYAEKVVRSSMGSILRLPVYEHADIPFLNEWKEASGLPFYGTALKNARPYMEIGALDQAVFIFGNEGNGIREDILSLTDENLYIPLPGHVESLNVSIAAAVILFHFING